jgi:hypothetical protein
VFDARNSSAPTVAMFKKVTLMSVTDFLTQTSKLVRMALTNHRPLTGTLAHERPPNISPAS